MKIESEDFRVPAGKTIKFEKWLTQVKPAYRSKKEYKEFIATQVEELSAQQQLHYASNSYAVLLIFQAMDVAGKDGAIRHVLSGVNSQDCQVFSLKHPSAQDADQNSRSRVTRPKQLRTSAHSSPPGRLFNQ